MSDDTMNKPTIEQLQALRYLSEKLTPLGIALWLDGDDPAMLHYQGVRWYGKTRLSSGKSDGYLDTVAESIVEAVRDTGTTIESLQARIAELEAEKVIFQNQVAELLREVERYRNAPEAMFYPTVPRIVPSGIRVSFPDDTPESAEYKLGLINPWASGLYRAGGLQPHPPENSTGHVSEETWNWRHSKGGRADE
jgi:hypothetical protein